MKKMLFFSLVCLSSVCFAKIEAFGYGEASSKYYDRKTNTVYVTEYPDSVEVWYRDTDLDTAYCKNIHISKFNKDPELRALKAEMEHAVRLGKAHVLE